MVGKILALLIILFIFYVFYQQYLRCKKGTGSLFNKVCHYVTDAM